MSACYQSLANLAEELRTNCASGLEFDEAASRYRSHPNLIPFVTPSLSRTLLTALARPQNLCLIAGATLHTLWSPWQRASLLWIAVSVAFLFQLTIDFTTKRTQTTLAQADLQLQVCLVFRAGRPVTVPWRGVVVGDILILRAGQRVAGDARLIEALALRTSETLISGEESPVSKDATAIVGAESDVFQQINMVFAHTRVVSGEGRALVVATGTDTYVARSNLLAINTHERETQLDADINRLTWLTTVASLLLIGAVLVLGYFRQYDDKFLVVGAATLVFACIPQNIPTLARCVLSMASSSLTHSKILIKKMSTAASLGSVTSVVTGKTSSLTENACALEVIGMYDRLNERQHAVPQANEVMYLRSLVHCWTLSAPPLSLPSPYAFQQAALRETNMNTSRIGISSVEFSARKTLNFDKSEPLSRTSNATTNSNVDTPKDFSDSFDQALIDYLASCGPSALRMFASEVSAASTTRYDPLALLQLMRRQQQNQPAAAPATRRYSGAENLRLSVTSRHQSFHGIADMTPTTPRQQHNRGAPTTPQSRVARLSSVGSADSKYSEDLLQSPPRKPQRTALASPTPTRPGPGLGSPNFTAATRPRYSEAVIAYFPFDDQRKLSSCLRCAITPDAAAAAASVAPADRQPSFGPRYALPDSWTHRQADNTWNGDNTFRALTTVDETVGDVAIAAGARNRALQPMLGGTGFSYHSPREFLHLQLSTVDGEEEGCSPHSFSSLSDSSSTLSASIPPSYSASQATAPALAPQQTANSNATSPPDMPYTLYVRGCAEQVVERCVAVELSDGQMSLLPPTSKAELFEHLDSISASGTRVFAVAKRQWALLPVLTIDRLVPSDIEKELVFVGFIACADQVRSEVHAAIEECRNAGISVKLASGDHRDACMHVARTLGVTARDFGASVPVTVDIDSDPFHYAVLPDDASSTPLRPLSPAPIYPPELSLTDDGTGAVVVESVQPTTTVASALTAAVLKHEAAHQQATRAHNDAVSRIAGGGREEAIDGELLNRVSGRALLDLVESHSVFTRVTAEHKRILVEALQGNGHRVAITCHAAAEQLALQTADVGAALDKLSSDAAREAAGAVLYDDSFSTLVAAIRAGRVMTFHLSQALTFSLSCKLALLLLAAISLAINGSMSPLPVAPLHAVVLAALIDSMAATVFTHAPVNARALMHRPPKPLTFDGAFWRRVLLEATVCGCAGLAALESVLWIHALKGSVAVAQSVTFIALILAVVLMACAEQVSFHRSAVVEPSEWTGDRNALIGWTIGVSLIVLTLFESHVGYAFSVEPLSLAQCGCALGSPLLTVALYWIVKNSCRSAN